MSKPFIIWTLRRTGGTTLASLLSTLSEHPKVPHEPFNKDRTFGSITTEWIEKQDMVALRRNIAEALAERPVIKHCYEILPAELNRVLMEVSTELGYRHVVLDRRAETDRILSLELARITGAWGGADTKKIFSAIGAGEMSLPPIETKHAVRHMVQCSVRRAEIDALFEELGQVPFVVYFEDVYSDPEAGRARVGRLLEFLEIDPSAFPNYAKLLDDALLKKGQNSASVMSAIPNIDKARTELDMTAAKYPPLFVAS